MKIVSDVLHLSYLDKFGLRVTVKAGQALAVLYSEARLYKGPSQSALPQLTATRSTGNSAYFFEYKPHLTFSFKVACPSKEQVHEERVEVVRFIFKSADQTLDKTSSKHLNNSFHSNQTA